MIVKGARARPGTSTDCRSFAMPCNRTDSCTRSCTSSDTCSGFLLRLLPLVIVRIVSRCTLRLGDPKEQWRRGKKCQQRDLSH